jgi:hypothetical protein
MRVGIDFDNTIASYDELMLRLAVDWGLITADVTPSKKVIRDTIRALPDGESKWRRLQTHSYGPGMRDAKLMDGLIDFLAECRGRAIPVFVVSHKTEFANFGDPTVNLRAAALEWMDRAGLLNPERVGLCRGAVYFEDTREQKIARIKALRITHFIDDLEETFLEASFPAEVGRILIARQPSRHPSPGWMTCGSWPEIRRHLLPA